MCGQGGSSDGSCVTAATSPPLSTTSGVTLGVTRVAICVPLCWLKTAARTPWQQVLAPHEVGDGVAGLSTITQTSYEGYEETRASYMRTSFIGLHGIFERCRSPASVFIGDSYENLQNGWRCFEINTSKECWVFHDQLKSWGSRRTERIVFVKPRGQPHWTMVNGVIDLTI